VLDPLKVVIENYPEGHEELLDAVNNPEDESAGTRKVPFSRELYIEREDFMENPPKGYFRLSPGVEVRLRYAYFLKCVSVVKDANGNVTEVRCTYDPASKGGNSPDGRKVKSTIHWLSAKHAKDAEVRLYDRLFNDPEPAGKKDGSKFTDYINPDSLKVVTGKVEPGLASAKPGEKFQFERVGYFCVDTKHSAPGKPVFNRTVTLRDTWAKEKGKG
jgi:glutaminyl-tRNA synthetase